MQNAKCKIMNLKRGIAPFSQLLVMGLLSIFILGANAGAVTQDDRATLEAQQQTLTKKVAMLKQEQDYLVFQKQMYAADSKYLVINLAKKNGQLKYKNRVLKNFAFSVPRKNLARSTQPGMLVLTTKTADAKDRFTLRFGSSFALQWKRDEVVKSVAGVPVLSLEEKEMLTIFLAVEEGALAYVIR
jgi:hypothetical protein